jgi:hypothetical protein
VRPSASRFPPLPEDPCGWDAHAAGLCPHDVHGMGMRVRIAGREAFPQGLSTTGETMGMNGVRVMDVTTVTAYICRGCDLIRLVRSVT